MKLSEKLNRMARAMPPGLHRDGMNRLVREAGEIEAEIEGLHGDIRELGHQLTAMRQSRDYCSNLNTKRFEQIQNLKAKLRRIRRTGDHGNKETKTLPKV